MSIAGCNKSPELPNIIWITSEDNSPLLGCYGDTFATTPNLDLLATEGFLYTKAYANTPVCEGDDAVFEELLEETKTKADEMQNVLQQGRDRLLELSSCNPDHAAEVVHDILSSTNQLELADYMERVCDQFGVDQQYHSLHSVVLQPGDHMHEHSFPGLSEDGLTATYDRSKALVREDMQFHTWEHPMVTGSMDMILSGEFGNATLCT